MEAITHPHSTHRNKLEMALRLKCKIRHHTTPRREYKQTFSDINHTSAFLGQPPKAIEIIAKVYKWNLFKLKRFAHQRKP